MTSGARTVDDHRRAPRLLLLATIGAVHFAAIWWLLSPTDPLAKEPASPVMASFDVVPIVLPEPPPPPPPLVAARRTPSIQPSAGGSPGRRRERPAPPIASDRDAAARQFEVTITPMALSLPPSGQVVNAAGIDLGLGTGADAGAGGADGRGTGMGRGTGPGDGDGGVQFARARWVTKPTDADFARVWPDREVDGKRVRYTGWAYLACRVRPSGQPYDCRTLAEKPAAVGMGAAAIDVATRSRVRPVFRNSTALSDLPVLIPIIFGPKLVRMPRVSAEVSAPPAR